MAITITKTKAPKKAKPVEVEIIEPSQMSDEDLADLYGSLDDRCKALLSDPVFAKFRQAAQALQARLDEYEATSEVKVKGAHWLIAASTCSKSPRRVLDNSAVAKMLGQEAFMKIAKVGVGDAKKYLTPEQVAGVVSKESYTKNRKVVASFLG